MREPSIEQLKNDGNIEGLIAALNSDKYTDLSDDDRGTQISQAAEALAELGAASAVEPIIAAVRNVFYNAHVRRLAVALLKLGDRQSIGDLLIAGLRNWDKGDGEKAAIALGEIGDIRAVEPLIAELKNGGIYGRNYWAADALGKLRDARALEPLMATLQYDQGVMREVAARALGEFNLPQAVEALIAVYQDSCQYYGARKAAAQALKRMGSPEAMEAIAIEPLIVALKDKQPSIRGEAVMKLGYLADPRALESLIQVLQDDDYSVRDKATSALKNFGDEAVDPLSAALKSDNWLVRKAAADVLGGMGVVDKSRHAVDVLIAILNDVEAIRRAATDELDDPCSLAVRELERVGGSDVKHAIEEYKARRSAARVVSTPAIQPQTAQSPERHKWWHFWK